MFGRNHIIPNFSQKDKNLGALGAALTAAGQAQAPFAQATHQSRIMEERDKRLHEMQMGMAKFQTDEAIRLAKEQSKVRQDEFVAMTPHYLDRYGGQKDLDVAGQTAVLDHKAIIDNAFANDQFRNRLTELGINIRWENARFKRDAKREDELIERHQRNAEALAAAQNAHQHLMFLAEQSGDKFKNGLALMDSLMEQVETGQTGEDGMPVRDFRYRILGMTDNEMGILSNELVSNPTSFGAAFNRFTQNTQPSGPMHSPVAAPSPIWKLGP